MAMKALCFQENDERTPKSIGSLSPVPWGFASFGSQPGHVPSCGQSISLDLNHQCQDGLLRCPMNGIDNHLDHKPYVSHHSILRGVGHKSSQPPASLYFHAPDFYTDVDVGRGHRVMIAKQAPIEECYGVNAARHPHALGRIMLPMNLATDDAPIFVNAKQYHGIMRRRKCREKALLLNKGEKKRQAYMHYSRHLHAKRRPRGSGGRFLNTRSSEAVKDDDHTKRNQSLESSPANSLISEIWQSDSRCQFFPNARKVSTCDVTPSIVNHHTAPARFFSGMNGIGRRDGNLMTTAAMGLYTSGE